MTIVGGKRVERVVRVVWLPVDDKDIRNSVVVGRAEIHTDGGGLFDALVVSCYRRNGAGDVTTELRAVAWERETRRFFSLPLSTTTGAPS